MSTRAERILKFVRNYINIRGYAPTRREIGKACGASTSVVNYNLQVLHNESRLTITRYVARGIVLTEPPAPDNADWVAANRMASK